MYVKGHHGLAWGAEYFEIVYAVNFWNMQLPM